MGITVTFLEQDHQRPEAIAALLVDFLSAKSSLHLALYDCRLSGKAADLVLGVLRARAAAGVDVRIAYAAGKPSTAPSLTRGDPAPPGTADFLARLGAGVKTRPVTGGDPNQPK